MATSHSPLPATPFLRHEKTGAVIIDLHVSPNAKQTRIAGLHDGALAVRLKAVPVDGQANAALVAWLSEMLGLPRNAVELVRGQTSKRKQFRVATGYVAQANWPSLISMGDPLSPN